MPIATAFSLALTIIQALPGAVTTAKSLIEDIKGHPDLTADEKKQLITQAKADVDAENVRVQAVE